MENQSNENGRYATSQMQQNLIDYMAKKGVVNHLQAKFMNDVANAVQSGKRLRLQANLKCKDEPAYAIADRIVLNYLKRNPKLQLTLATRNTELKSGQFIFSASSKTSQLGFLQDNKLIPDLLAWNKVRLVEEEARKKREEEEALRAEEEQNQKAEEEKLRLIQEEEEEEIEQEPQPVATTRAVSVAPVRTVKNGSVIGEKKAAPMARSVYGERRKQLPDETRSQKASYQPGSVLRFKKRQPESLLPEGSRSPPNSPTARSQAPPRFSRETAPSVARTEATPKARGQRVQPTARSQATKSVSSKN